MRRSFLVLMVVGALALASLGIAGAAGADEALADGSYTLTVPGVGDVQIQVSGKTATVTAAPTGFEGLVGANASNEGDLTFASADGATEIEVEVDGGVLDAELKVDDEADDEIGPNDDSTADDEIGADDESRADEQAGPDDESGADEQAGPGDESGADD